MPSAVQDGDADLEFGNLAVNFPRAQALTQQCQSGHICLNTASAMASASSSPERPDEVFRCSQLLIFTQNRATSDFGLRVIRGPGSPLSLNGVAEAIR